MHHKTVALQGHFLPHKTGKQREALLSQTPVTSGDVRPVAEKAGALNPDRVSKDSAKHLQT